MTVSLNSWYIHINIDNCIFYQVDTAAAPQIEIWQELQKVWWPYICNQNSQTRLKSQAISGKQSCQLDDNDLDSFDNYTSTYM